MSKHYPRPANDRGFMDYGAFKDARGMKVTVRESSGIGPPEVWILTEVDPERPPCTGLLQPPILGRRAAKCLIKALTRFLEDTK